MPQSFGVVGINEGIANSVILKLEAKIENIIKEMALLQHEKDEETLIRLSELTQKRDRFLLQLEDAHTSLISTYSGKKGAGISVGNTVTLKKDDQQLKVRIVSEYEVNTSAGAISSTSPLGSQLIGKNKGDVVKVETPIGIVAYEVLNFE